MIESYTFGQIQIDQKTFTHDVIVTAGGVDPWWRKTSHNVEPADIDSAVKKQPRLMIFGTGFYGNMQVTEKTRTFIKEHGVELIVQKTEDAIETFNQSGEEHKVGLFHLTC